MQDFKTTLYQIIGDRIKLKRKELKISQVSLSNDLDLSRSSLSNVEVGRHQTPLHVLYQIAELLTLDINELIPSPKELTQEMSLQNSELKDLRKKEELSSKDLQNIQDIIKDL